MDYSQGFGKHVLKNCMAVLNNCDAFQAVFKTRLKPFWEGNILGFDVLAFDKWLDVPDGMSTNECILNRFGQEGLVIIDNLLAFE